MSIMPDDPFWVICKSCWNNYSLLLATVCPNCFAWPKREQIKKCQIERLKAEARKDALIDAMEMKPSEIAAEIRRAKRILQ